MSTTLDETFFTEAFCSLLGFPPLTWQGRLFRRFVSNDLPGICDIPTGLGKTSVLAIWLLALVHQADTGAVRLPRRLIYIVNRRTVVDQATDVVDAMRRRLIDPENGEWRDHAQVLRGIATTLHGLRAMDGAPLAVSTLRGELADNEEWKVDPARPAIVVGTIDMIGSKLLFSGYGDGPYSRAHHAGLIGHDSLIVHDEAHLTPAFSDLLRAIALEQDREAQLADLPGAARPVCVMELSATSRRSDAPEDGHPDPTFTLEAEDEKDKVVQHRLAATKRLHLHPTSEDSVVARIVDLSSSHETAGRKVLIYVRSPERAQQVAAALAKTLGTRSHNRVALLTGTIRGHERDQLVRTDLVYRALLDPERRVGNTVYLVSTSAGEVGIDLDADHLVCDVTSLDALIQRLGRVNRRGGECRDARVDLVCDAPTSDGATAVDEAIRATLSLLQDWDEASQGGIDVSPGSLRKLLIATSHERIGSAFSPRPDAPPLTDIFLDAWSLTSIEAMQGRPEVAPFLHGLTHDPPETFVAWRHEVKALADAVADEAALSDWFRACRIQARERLRDRTQRVKKALGDLLESHRKREDSDLPVVLLDERGRAQLLQLGQIVEKDFELAYRTVLLPVEAGGLDGNGMLDPKAVVPADGLELDVADIAGEGLGDDRRERWLHRRTPDGERWERLITRETRETLPSGLREKARLLLEQPDEGDVDAEMLDLVLVVSPRGSAVENPETASAQQRLAAHTEAVTLHMTSLAEHLGLPASIGDALVAAARLHDRGKDRPVWQRYARNVDGAEPVAKARRYLHPRALGGYRHEFGSLLDAMADDEVRACAEADLVLHLIAAHHDWGRPHFERRSYDNSRTTADNDAAACGVMRRFGLLQQRFGRWGLAWLESLLRCADIAASRQAVESPDRAPQEAEA